MLLEVFSTSSLPPEINARAREVNTLLRMPCRTARLGNQKIIEEE